MEVPDIVPLNVPPLFVVFLRTKLSKEPPRPLPEKKKKTSPK